MTENKQIDRAKTSWLTITVIGMVALVFILPIGMKKIKAAKDKDLIKIEEVKPVAVKCAKVTKGGGIENVSLAGKLLAWNDVMLSAEKPGRIVEISADKGMPVKAGQIIIKLDSRIAETMLSQAKLQNEETASELKRYNELKKTGAVSDSLLDSLTKRAQLAEAQMRAAEISLSMCEVKTPVDGTVDSRLVEVGEYVNEGRNVARIINSSKVKAAFDIPEKYLLNLKKGGKVTYRVDTLDKDFSGDVTFIASAANHENSTFSAEIVTENSAGDLRPGMLVEVYLPVKRDAADVIVPLSAVIPRKGDYFAFVVSKEGKAEKRLVKIRQLVGNDAVVMSGLTEGEDLVVEGQRGIQDGLAVTVEK